MRVYNVDGCLLLNVVVLTSCAVEKSNNTRTRMLIIIIVIVIMHLKTKAQPGSNVYYSITIRNH